MTDAPEDRNHWLTADDATLLRQCRVSTRRGSGPGGQKRNKTESAVQLLHLPTGVAANDDTTRSQHTNRVLALRRLRQQLALALRRPPVPAAATIPPAVDHPAYPLWLAVAFDHLATQGFRISEAATALQMTTGALVKALSRDTDAWQKLAAGRIAAGLPPLKPK